MSRILVTGAGGQLGRALVAHLGARAWPLSRAELAIEDEAAVARALDDQRPGAIVNAAAFTNVDRAEAEPEAAFRTNRDGPAVLARAAAARGLPLVHVSTDHVFDGSGAAPWREDDPTGPVNLYGRSKLAGERAVLEAHPGALVVRTSWVFSNSGKSFVTMVLRLAREQGAMRIVADQHGCPTPAAALARASVELLARGATGVLHFCGQGATTRHAFAEAIVAAAGLEARVEPVTSAAFAAPARRPLNGVLDSGRARALGVVPGPWLAALAAAVAP